MFTSSVLNNSFRMSESTLTGAGGLHLNALNGSSNVLGGFSHSASDGPASSSSSENAFGGLFGVSLSDNHPYRPLDSGRSFHESSNNRKQSSCGMTSSPSREDAGIHKKGFGGSGSAIYSNSNGGNNSEAFLTTSAVSTTTSTTTTSKKHSGRFVSHSPLSSRRRQYLYHADSTDDSMSPLSMRRYSLNIDTDRISTHAQCGSDLSLSLEDVSVPRCGAGEAAGGQLFASQADGSSRMPKGGKHTSGSGGSLEDSWDLGRLAIAQVDLDSSEPGPAHSKHGGHHTGRRTKRQHAPTADVSNLVPVLDTNSRAGKMLDKIRESKKTEHSKSKQKTSNNNASLATREKSPRPSSTSRHHVTHSSSHVTCASSTPAKKEPRQRIHKATFSRHSFD